MSGLSAFKEAFMSTGALDDSDFSDFNARRLRYDVLWSMYENTAYRNIHTWANKLRTDYGLYKHIRNVYNPAFRLGEFWQIHLMGGMLDPDAGDGQEVPSALPIATDNEALRPAIARLWRDSGWQIRKDVFTLYGALMGDVALKVIDDRDRRYVYLQLVHPGTIKDITVDAQGNVKGYELEAIREDPRNADRTVTYTELAERGQGDEVIYQTLLNGQVYPWDGGPGAWTEQYGFIPMVLVKHNDVGKMWGWSEMHAGLGKFREADDLASKTHDHIRKYVDPPWFASGVTKATSTPNVTHTAPTATKPEPMREELPIIYGPQGSDMKPMVADLDLEATLNAIKEVLAEIERDYPELQMDIWRATGDASGKALRIARQRTEAKVNQRRPNYDDGLKRAQQMAVAIGGFRSYEGYAGFNLDSFKAGTLDHTIARRPVFTADPLDDIEREQAFWTAARTAVSANMPLDLWLESQGWDEEELEKLRASPQYQSIGSQA